MRAVIGCAVWEQTGLRDIHSAVDGGDGKRRETAWQYTDSADGSACTYAQYQDGVLQSRIGQQFDGNGICVYQAEYTAEGALASETFREVLE